MSVATRNLLKSVVYPVYTLYRFILGYWFILKTVFLIRVTRVQWAWGICMILMTRIINARKHGEHKWLRMIRCLCPTWQNRLHFNYEIKENTNPWESFHKALLTVWIQSFILSPSHTNSTVCEITRNVAPDWVICRHSPRVHWWCCVWQVRRLNRCYGVNKITYFQK